MMHGSSDLGEVWTMRRRSARRVSNGLESRCYYVKKRRVYDFGEGVLVHIDPSTSDELCPISHERFQDVELEIAKGKSFLPRNPDVCMATLECGHRFSLLAIMYQFVLVDMRCPLCRAGPSARARLAHIPHAFRKSMRVKGKAMRQEEKEEQESSDAQTALDIDQEQDEWTLGVSNMILEENRVNMTVYMYSPAREGLHGRLIHYQNHELLRVNGGMRFLLPVPETQDIIDALHNTHSDSIRISVHYRGNNGVPIELANTPVILTTLLDTQIADLIFDTADSSLQLIIDAESGLRRIEWHSI
jgi:hypothetical protein